VAQRFTACGKTRFICGQSPSAAKAGLILWNLAARPEAAPFKTVYKSHFSASCSSAAITVLFFNGGFSRCGQDVCAIEFFRSLGSRGLSAYGNYQTDLAAQRRR
jgi:hypothetical protein